MKHLNPDHISALADGLRPTAADVAHLGACPACRRELAELRSLAGGLDALKTPPPALRQATLRRLGLAPRARAGLSAWAWGPALAAGLALLWILPLVRTRIPSTPALSAPPLAALPPVPVLPAPPHSHRTVPARHDHPRSAPASRSVLAALPLPPVRASAGLSGTLLAPPQAQAPAALGAAAAAKPLSRSAANILSVADGADVKATPTPSSVALAIISVRNNLLKPALGERLGFTVSLPQAEPVKAIVLDSRGRTVATLYDAPAGPEPLELTWDGGTAASGAYTVLVHSQDSFTSLKVLVVR